MPLCEGKNTHRKQGENMHATHKTNTSFTAFMTFWSTFVAARHPWGNTANKDPKKGAKKAQNYPKNPPLWEPFWEPCRDLFFDVFWVLSCRVLFPIFGPKGPPKEASVGAFLMPFRCLFEDKGRHRFSMHFGIVFEPLLGGPMATKCSK